MLRLAKISKEESSKKIEKRVIFGQTRDQSEISINLLERQNLTFRQDNTISRKTIRLSKKFRSLYNQIRFIEPILSFVGIIEV